MADSKSNQDVFDVERIRSLVELMKEHELSEISLQQDKNSIQLRRDQEVTMVPAPQPVAPAPAAPAAAPAAPAAAPSAPADENPNIVEIKSPMVGTLYAKPNPDAPAYVQVGDMIGPETVVCIVEAMKVFNEIQAEISGKIVAVLVDNEEPVEFGQPLFRVDTKPQ